MKHTHSVDVPLIIFSVGFFIILFGLFSKLSFQKKPFIEQKATQTINPPPTEEKKRLSLDYNKPLICNLHSKDASISAQISGSLIAVQIAEQVIKKQYVVNGDCVYSWIVGQTMGKKQCGVGQYITVGRQLLGSGLASPDSLGVLMKQMGKSTPVNIGAMIETCKNVKIVDEDMFMVPKSMVFK